VKYKVLMGIVIVALMFIPLACQHEESPELQCFPPNWTVENETEFLSLCDQCNINFSKHDFGEYGFVYYHQRRIGNATVMWDEATYQFDMNGEFTSKIIDTWRDDLPDELPEILVSKQEAIKIAGGGQHKKDTAELCYIEKSCSFDDLEETPVNPVWVASLWTAELELNVVVVDAITGKILGHGSINYLGC